MRKALTCGRTAPVRGVGALSALKDRAETLSARVRRVKPLHGAFAWHPLLDMDNELPFHCCPLPTTRLADGTRPFVIDTDRGTDWYGGTLPMDGPADPRIATLWGECLAARPVRANFRFVLHPPEMLADVIFELDLYVRDGGLEAEVDLDYWMRDSEPDGLARFLTTMGLDRYAGAEDLRPRPAPTSRESRRLILPGIPPYPDLPARLTAALERLGWVDDCVLESMEFLIKDDEEPYSSLRPRLNAIARGWDSEISGAYRPDFDPFLSSPAPSEGEDYRFPVALYVKRDKDVDEPTIQFDVVHSREGSFLEFLSAGSEKTLRRYANLADVEDGELEIWRGPASDRWGH